MDGRREADEFERMVIAALLSLVTKLSTRETGSLRRTVLACVEGPLLRHVLKVSGGNQLKAARLLGMNRNTLRVRLRLFGLLSPRPVDRPRQREAHAPRRGFA